MAVIQRVVVKHPPLPHPTSQLPAAPAAVSGSPPPAHTHPAPESSCASHLPQPWPVHLFENTLAPSLVTPVWQSTKCGMPMSGGAETPNTSSIPQRCLQRMYPSVSVPEGGVVASGRLQPSKCIEVRGAWNGVTLFRISLQAAFFCSV